MECGHARLKGRRYALDAGNGKTYFGYKNHMDVDTEYKLIRNLDVTPTNVYTSQILGNLIGPDNADPDVGVHGAYRSGETEGVLVQVGYGSHI